MENEKSDKKQKKCELVASGQNYDGGGIRTSLHGTIYQLNLLMLFLNRALKKQYIFSLATEVEAAGKFDDLVFKYEKNKGNSNFRFLQAKHRQDISKKISEADILNETGGDFSVQKYYISYLTIKNAKRKFFKGEFEDFIIFTNIDIQSDLLTNFDAITDLDPILEFEKKSCRNIPKRFKFKPGTQLYEKLLSLLAKNPDFPKIAHELGEMATNYVQNHSKKGSEFLCTIEIQDIFNDNCDWIMENIFDINKKTQKGNKSFFELREDFLNPLTDDMKNYNEIFFKAYLAKQGNNETLENIKERLSCMKFELARSFLKRMKKDNKEGDATNPSTNNSEIKDFVNKFVFAVNQPNEEELKNIVEEEIGNRLNMNWFDAELVTNKLQVCILNWAKKRNERFITSQDCTELFTEIANQLAFWGQLGLTVNYKRKIDEYNCFFDTEHLDIFQDIKSFLMRDRGEQILLVCYDSWLLTEIKLFQINELINTDEYIMFSEMKTFHDQVDENSKYCPLKSFSSKICSRLFLAIHDDVDIRSKSTLMKLFAITSENQDKQIILTVSLNSYNNLIFLSEILKHYTFLKVVDTCNKFEDLTLKTQFKLLEETNIKLHGSLVNLGDLIDDDLIKCLSGDMLVKIVKSRTINIKEAESDKLYNEVKELYVDRSLHRRIFISRKILNDNDFITTTNSEVAEITNEQEVLLISDKRNEKYAEHYYKLCKDYDQNIHFLVKQNNEFIWEESRGSILKLRKHVYVKHDNQNEDFNNFFTSDVEYVDSRLPIPFLTPNLSINYGKYNVRQVTDLNDRVVLISAEPGMGKSTLLSHIAHSDTQVNGLSVFRFNLSDYCEYFDEQSFSSDTLNTDNINFLFQVSKLNVTDLKPESRLNPGFVVQSCGKLEITTTFEVAIEMLQIKLFTHLYNKGKIAILVDGFDEIAPDYNEQVLTLLEALKKSRVQRIWVTTRSYNIVDHLENKLGTFSFKLVPLSEQEQIHLFKKIWERKINGHIELEHLKHFVYKHISIIYWHIFVAEENKNQSAFMGIPLHVQMLAAVYEKSFCEYYENQISNSVQNMQRNISIPQQPHDKLTLYDLYYRFFRLKFQILYREINLQDPRYKRKFEKELNEEMAQHGKLALLELFGKKQIPYKLLEIEQDTTEQDLIKSIRSGATKTGFVLCIDESDHPHFVHRTFAEFFAADLLANILLTKTDNGKYKVAKDFLYKYLTNDSSNSLSILLFLSYKMKKINTDSKMIDAIDLALRNIPYTYSTLEQDNKLWFEQDDLFKWTPIHYGVVAHDCTQFDFATFKNFIHSKIIEVKDDNGATPYILAARRGCSGKCIFALLQKHPLSIDAHDNTTGKTALHYALARSDENAESFAKAMIRMGADLFTADNECRTPFQIINSNKHVRLIGSLIRRMYDKNLSPLALSVYENVHNQVLNNTDSCVFYMSRERELATALVFQAGIDVNMQDSKGKTALHYAFQRIHLDCTNTLLFLLENGANVYIKDKEQKLPSYYDRDYMLEIFAKGQSPKLFFNLEVKVLGNKEIMKPFVLSMTHDKDITVQLLSRYNSIASVLVDNDPEIVNVIDSNGKSALHYAVILLRPQNVVHLLHRGACVVVKDNDYKTPLQYLKMNRNGTDEQICYNIKYFNTILYEMLRYGACYDDIKEYSQHYLVLMTRGLYEALETDDIELVSGYLNFINNVMINAKNSEGLTPLHVAIHREQTEIILCLLSHGAIFNFPNDDTNPWKNSSNEKIRDIENLINNLFLSIENNDEHMFLECVNQNMSAEFINAFFKKNTNGLVEAFQPLHLAIKMGNHVFVQKLLQCGAKSEINTFENDSVLHIACQGTSEKVMDTLLNYLTLGQLYEMFTCKNIHDQTPIERAVLFGNVKVLEVLLKKIKLSELEDRLDLNIIIVIQKALDLAKSTKKSDLIKVFDNIFDGCDKYQFFTEFRRHHEVLTDENFKKSISQYKEDEPDYF